MNRCRNCGETIDEQQADNFNGLCPACVRQSRSPQSRDNLSCELGIWAIMMWGGVLVVLGSLVGPLWLSFLMPVLIPGFIAALSPFIVIGAVTGIIVAWFGRKMYRETKAKGNAQY
ncbi:MAG: hypothetical protein ACFFED_04855 [Candidatus Thorarchaeota archaeon]